MRKLARVCFAFAAAVALGVYGTPGVWLLGIGAVCLLGFALLLLLRSDRARALGLLLLGLGLGAIYVTYYDNHNVRPLKQMVGTTQVLQVELQQTPEPNQYGWRAVGWMEIGSTVGKVLLYGTGETDAELGDVVEGEFQISDSQLRYSEEDLYYQSRDISLICRQKGSIQVKKVDSLPVHLWPTAVGEGLEEKIQQVFPQETAGLVQALLTGNRSGMDYSAKNDLSRSGISHTVAVSGMHVAVLLSMVFLLTGKRRILMTWIGCPVVLIFMAVTGFSPSVVRAGLMQIILLLAPVLNRENDWPTTLSFSLAVILLSNPWAIASVSLQLSYAAVIGIALFTGRVYRVMTQPEKVAGWMKAHKLFGKGYGYVAATVSTTFGALMLTTPLVAFYFGSVSLMSFVTNLLTLFAVSGCFTLGLLAALAGCVWLGAGKILAIPASWLARYLLWVSRGIASVPYAAARMDNPCLLAWLVFSYILFGIFLCIRVRRPKITVACCTVLALVCSIFCSIYDANRGTCRVTALNVGQGQCIVMQCGDFSAMFDCGGSYADQAGERAAQFLEERGAAMLDVLVLSHYDLDHVGGVPQLFYRVKIGLLLLPDVPDEGGTRQEIEQLAADNGTQIAYVRQDTEVTFSGGKLTVFAPVLHKNDNDASLCAVFAAENLNMLVTGDLSQTGEQCLLALKQLLEVDILVAGHHGAVTSTGEGLLEQTQPQYVLISVGENSYGHPDPVVLLRIAAAGAEILRTDECGNITIWR